MVNWAGKAAVGKTLVGRKRSLKLNQFKLMWPSSSRTIKQSAPLGGAYKTLFVLAANAAGDIQPGMLAGLDTIRRAWEQYFPLVTNRRVDTAAPF
jgi:hypothetical protein